MTINRQNYFFSNVASNTSPKWGSCIREDKLYRLWGNGRNPTVDTKLDKTLVMGGPSSLEYRQKICHGS